MNFDMVDQLQDFGNAESDLVVVGSTNNDTKKPRSKKKRMLSPEKRQRLDTILAVRKLKNEVGYLGDWFPENDDIAD